LVSRNQAEARSISGLFAYHRIIVPLLDLVFPPRCSGCGRVDTAWCEHCQRDLLAVPVQVHTIEIPDLLGVAASGVHEGVLQDAVQALKYHNVQHVAQALGTRLIQCLAQLNWTFDLILPVPLHPERLKKRGYNQAGLIAEVVSHHDQRSPQPDALRRVQYTRSQVGLNRSQRLQNVIDAFIADPQQVSDKIIVLIDDVRTTGATLRACATALHAAGAAGVYALTVTVARD